MEPGYMGPNSLPVPKIADGSISQKLSLETDIDLHFSPGDKTQNLFLDLNIPIQEKVNLKIWWAPIEHFSTDTNTRDMRRARGKDPEGWSVGDVYIATVIALAQNHDKWPDVTLGINIKTASGNNLENARHTDAPAYYFDLAFGKTYSLDAEGIYKIRPYAMGGFYVYQTNRQDYYQNDCILWGTGLDFSIRDWEIKNQVGGYIGYFGTLDRPTVYRFQLWFKQKVVHYQFQFQVGNGSYPYNSVRLGTKFILK